MAKHQQAFYYLVDGCWIDLSGDHGIKMIPNNRLKIKEGGTGLLDGWISRSLVLLFVMSS